jgi:hypothetical protein
MASRLQAGRVCTQAWTLPMTASAIIVFDSSRPQHQLENEESVRTACVQTLSKTALFSGPCERPSAVTGIIPPDAQPPRRRLHPA